MVWGAISSTFKSQLVICNGNMNADRYINQVIRPVILPMFQQRNGLTFMQDNAPPHKARVTMNLLNANNIPVLDWPALSPDCNPIEHLWDYIGRQLRQRQPTPTNVQELTAALQDEWQRIPRRVYRRLCQSVPNRIQEVIRRNGGATRF